jgi:glucokinase
MTHLGIDLGGTKTALGIVNTKGKIVDRTSFESFADDFEGYFEILNHQIHKFLGACDLSPESLKSIGVGCAGQIEMGTGKIFFSPNLGWKDAPLGEGLRANFPQAVVTVDNDVRAATLGEYLFGLKERVGIYVNVFLGTGIGSGLIIHNKILRGASNSAGEIGQTSIKFDGPAAPNGNHGVYEYYGSGTGLTRIAKEYYKEHPGCLPVPSEEDITGKMVSEEAEKGNKDAIEILRLVGFHVGVGLTNIINFLNPHVITFGGGLGEIGPLLNDPMMETVKERAIPSAASAVEIRKARLGNDAGIIGAAFLHLIDSEGNIRPVND